MPGGNRSAGGRADSAQSIGFAEKAALPTLAGTTGLRVVQDCTTVALVPLSCGNAAAAVINEKSKRKSINEAAEVMKNVVHQLIQAYDSQIDIYTMSPARIVDLKASRRIGSKNESSGIFKLRVLAGFESHLAKALTAHILCELDTVRTYELDVDAEAYPGSVIQELYSCCTPKLTGCSRPTECSRLGVVDQGAVDPQDGVQMGGCAVVRRPSAVGFQSEVESPWIIHELAQKRASATMGAARLRPTCSR